jgi:hypothetical protein
VVSYPDRHFYEGRPPLLCYLAILAIAKNSIYQLTL